MHHAYSRWFLKEQYTLKLMQPIAEDLAEAGVAAWNIEFKRWSPDEEGVWMDTLSDVLRAWGHLALMPGIDLTFHDHGAFSRRPPRP